MAKSKIGIVFNSMIKENPVLVLLLGLCPTLGTSSSAINGMSMGLATTAVLIFSNILISVFKKVIPDKVRIPCFHHDYSFFGYNSSNVNGSVYS